VAPRLERWGYLTPGPAPIDETADWRAIELLPGSRVRLRRAVRIDLGGIAKGYAVDRAIDALRTAGVDCALVNAGGDLRTTGPRSRNVGLRHPLDPSRIGATVRLQGAALASSSACFSRRSVPTGPVSALLDPRSGQAFTGGGSVSVIAPQCLVADALTKVVLFASADVCRDLLRACGARALLLPAAEWAA
jgi:thiamine biosynthesis lipoprotein